MKASIELEVENPTKLEKILKPEASGDRLPVKILSNKNLIIKIKAEKLSELKGAINSYLRLVKVANAGKNSTKSSAETPRS